MSDQVFALDASTGHQIWGAPTSSCVQSGVVVLGNLAFVTLGTGDLQAFHLSDGSPAWSASGASAPFKNPTVGAGVVFAVGYPGRQVQQTIYAFDPATGHTLWTFPLNAQGGGFPEITGQPVVDNGVLYMAESGGAGTAYLYAIRISDHTQLWSKQVNGLGLAVANGSVYAGGLSAYNASTGNILWTQPVANELGPVIAANGVVYSSGQAFDVATGHEKWSYSVGGNAVSILAAANGVAYATSNDNSLYALDAATGQLQWKAPTYGAIYYTPVLGNGAVYVGTSSGSLYAFRT